MRIYFASPIRGDRSRIEISRFIVGLVKRLGHEVLTVHNIKNKEETIKKENEFGFENVYERDMRWLMECDLLIAEATAPSFGVGYEVGYFLNFTSINGNKKAIILYDKNMENEVSAMVTGNTHQNAVVFGYKTKEEIEKFLRKYF